MSKLLRYPNPHGSYFITCVTYERQPLLIKNFDLLKKAAIRLVKKHSIKIEAYIILPDHIHALINIEDYDISEILHRFKTSFSAQFYKRHHTKRVWQKRFWDHIIRDQDDWNHHLDYIHYNPAKHGYISDPKAWQYSSINRFKEYYPNDWGVHKEIKFLNDGFGE
ncbi:MAG: transposase [Candidatus Zixiibacteriota bacterium]